MAKILGALVLGVALLLPAAAALAESEKGGFGGDRLVAPVAIQTEPSNLGTVAGGNTTLIEPREDHEYRDK